MGMMRAVAPPVGSLPVRAWQVARGLPRLALGFPSVVAATCEVAQMLSEPLGLGPAVSQLFAYEGERWDGRQGRCERWRLDGRDESRGEAQGGNEQESHQQADTAGEDGDKTDDQRIDPARVRKEGGRGFFHGAILSYHC